MKKLKAETLIEIVTAMAVFGVISAGLFDFMANQILHLARVRDRENMLYAAQKLISCSSFDVVEETNPKPIADTGMQYTFHDNTLTLINGSSTMSFTIQ
mgnify:CR=1 FL=1